MTARQPWSDRGSRRERGYGHAWDKLRLVILKRDGYLCQCPDCQATGRTVEAIEVDHIIPKAEGGTDDPSNLRAVSAACHRRLSLEQRGHKPKPRISVDGWPIE